MRILIDLFKLKANIIFTNLNWKISPAPVTEAALNFLYAGIKIGIKDPLGTSNFIDCIFVEEFGHLGQSLENLCFWLELAYIHKSLGAHAKVTESSIA